MSLEINRFFSEKVGELRQKFGIKDIILDPGFGFGKTIEQQHQMLDELSYIGFGGLPMLIGISRKSFIYKPLGKSPLEIEQEVEALHQKALQKGAKSSENTIKNLKTASTKIIYYPCTIILFYYF